MLTDDPAKVHVSFETAAGAVVGAGRYSRYGTLRAAAAALLPTGSARHYLHATQVVADADQQLAAIAGARAKEIGIVVSGFVPSPTTVRALLARHRRNYVNYVNMSRMNHYIITFTPNSHTFADVVGGT
jgi:hypothetical protein